MAGFIAIDPVAGVHRHGAVLDTGQFCVAAVDAAGVVDDAHVLDNQKQAIMGGDGGDLESADRPVLHGEPVAVAEDR